MALEPKYASRVKETTTTTGTGTLSLAGVVAGFRTFVAGIGDGETCFYVIEAVDADGVPTGDWETGLGTVADSSSGHQLARTTVLESSNADVAVNFGAGTKNVFCDLLPRGMMEVGCKAKIQTTNFSNQNATWEAVDLDAEDWDPFGMHDNVTNNSRVTIAVPGRYLVIVTTTWAANTTGIRGHGIATNGALGFNRLRFDAGSSGSNIFTMQSMETLELAANDYVEMYAYQSSGGALNVLAYANSGITRLEVQRIAT